jgi:hypothetical protein
MVIPPNIMEAYLANMSVRTPIRQAREKGLLEERIHDCVNVYLHMNEREVAIIAFPLANGRFDYLGFTSTDGRVHAWCHELFLHYWANASNRQQLVEEAYQWITQHPDAMRAFNDIAQGKRTPQHEVVSQLERVAAIHAGKLTIIGETVREMLR